MFPEDFDKHKQASEEVETSGDVLNMSDEDMENMSFEDFVKKQGKPEEDKEESSGEDVVDESEDNEEDSESEEAAEEVASRNVFDENTSEDEEDDDNEEEEETPPQDIVEPRKKAPEVDYESEYKKLLEPFRAADRDVKVNNVDEARRLMQMGVDYSRKMQSLKPHLKIMKALQGQNLLDERKVNHLIDISKGNHEAIVQLLKDHAIDPVDLDLSDEKEYSPQSYTPSDRQQALEEVLDSIKDSPSYQRTLDELGTKWDDESRAILMEHPQTIAKINDHIEMGIYDQIMAEVAREKALGTFYGPDIVAYKTIGEKLQANGMFAHLAESKPKSERKPQDSGKMKQRKRAAAPPRKSPKTAEPVMKSPLSMSDEEFEKQFSRVMG